MKLERTPGFGKSAQLRTGMAHTGLAWWTCLRPGAEGRDLLESCPCHVLGWVTLLCLLPGPRRLGGSSGAGALGTPIQQVQRWGVWRGFYGGMYLDGSARLRKQSGAQEA